MKHGQSFKTMAITINGTGTLTGVSVGGLPDGIVDTDMLAADSVTAPKIGSKTFTSYAIICDQKGTSTSGGTSSTGTFNTRDLNTELADPDGIVSISSNQFTLQAGTYLIRASAPAYKAQEHQIIIWNQTDLSITAVGTSEYSNTVGTTTRAFAVGRTTIGSAKAFEIRQRVGNGLATHGLGVNTNYDTLASIYTIVEIYKEA